MFAERRPVRESIEIGRVDELLHLVPEHGRQENVLHDDGKWLVDQSVQRKAGHRSNPPRFEHRLALLHAEQEQI